jgi:hypothetical protein
MKLLRNYKIPYLNTPQISILQLVDFLHERSTPHNGKFLPSWIRIKRNKINEDPDPLRYTDSGRKIRSSVLSRKRMYSKNFVSATVKDGIKK